MLQEFEKLPEKGLTTEYRRVNEALCIAFLSGRFSSRALYLTLDQQAQELVSTFLGKDQKDIENYCCRVVGESLCRQGNPYDNILTETKEWRVQNTADKPPFLAILYALSHAAELMAADGELAPNNYYIRLSQVTGMPVDILKKHAKSSQFFWNLFANWLADNDYELGRPTASATGTWKFVGLAMSQAFVRASDRELFHDIFDTYGFTVNERLTADELWPYLDVWMSSSKPNTRLKEAWRKKELRNRLCEIALDEFYDWASFVGGSRSSINSSKSVKRMTLIAAIVPTFPHRSLSLQLGRSEELDQSMSGLLDAKGREFSLGNTVYGAFATLSPNPLGLGASSITQRQELTGEGGTFNWSPRLVIPLVKSEDGAFWSEVSRVAFGDSHLLLVRNIPKMVTELESFLSVASTGEAKSLDHTKLDHLPEGWLLYSDVSIKLTDFDLCPDLQHLVPLSVDLGISVIGGLQMLRGVWHSNVPPRVDVVAKKGPTRLDLLQPRIHGNTPVRTEHSPGRRCAMYLDGLGDGSYFASGYTGKKEIGEKTALLRSSGRPRPLNRQAKGTLVHYDLITASQQTDDEELPMVHGHELTAIISAEVADGSEHSFQVHGNQVPSGENERASDIRDFPDAPQEQHAAVKDWQLQSCAERGFHVWKCESRHKIVSLSTPLQMECKGCGAVVLMKNRGEKTASSKNVTTPIVPHTPSWGGKSPLNEYAEMDHDLFFDALCYLGNGAFSRMESIVSDVDLEPWKLGEVAASYSALGLLDISYKPDPYRVGAWSVPPPVVFMVGDTTACHSGFRSEELVKEMEAAISSVGGKFYKTDVLSQPSKITIQGLHFESLARALAGLEDPLGRALTVVEDFATSFSRIAANMGGYGKSLIPASVGANLRNLQKFDVREVRWKTVEHTEGTGAYRFDHFGRSYVFRTGEGSVFAGPQQVVKLLAARSSGTRLHAYDQANLTFSSTLGAEPMGLLDRALVSCSGELPSQEQQGLSVYSRVSPKLANAVLKILYKEEII